MTEPARFYVDFASTDDADLDAETTLLEDSPMTIDEIFAACAKYRVRARIVENGHEARTIIPENERESSAREGVQ